MLFRTLGVGVGAAVAGAMVVRGRDPIALITMSLLGLGFLIVLSRAASRDASPEDQRRLLGWTLAAFAAHLIFSFAVSSTSASVKFFGGDAVTYHQTATQILNHWIAGGVMPHLPSGKEGFYYLLAGLYWVFGPHQSAGLAVNAAFAAGLIPVVTDSTRRLFGERAVRYVAPLLLLLPGLFVWTSQLLKEAPILFFIAVAMNCAVRMTERFSAWPIVLFAASTAVLLTFRGHVGVFIAAGLFAGVILGRRQLLSGVGTGAVVLGVVALVVVGGGVGESGFEVVTTASFEQANNTRIGLAYNTGSGYGGENVDISSSGGAARYLPLGLVNFMLGPFPWQGGGARQLFAIPDVLVWYWLLPSLWVGYQQARRLIGRRLLLALFPAMTSLVVLALVISNYGTVVREREQIVVLLVPFIALGLASRAESRQTAKATTMPVGYWPARPSEVVG